MTTTQMTTQMTTRMTITRTTPRRTTNDSDWRPRRGEATRIRAWLALNASASDANEDALARRATTNATTTSASALKTIEDLSPTWRMFLLSDGSVTRHLQAMFQRDVEVEVKFQGERADADERAPKDCARIKPGRIVVREVWLGVGANASGERRPPAVYASSWWNAEEMERFMPEKERSMWANLRTQHAELYREIREVYCGYNDELERAFGVEGPFWGRHYIFWHRGEPITVVYEVFNPAALSDALGPTLRET